MVNLTDQLRALWPDTDVAWMSRSNRVVQLQRWVRQVVAWLRSCGAPRREVIQALEGAVAWLEHERWSGDEQRLERRERRGR